MISGENVFEFIKAKRFLTKCIYLGSITGYESEAIQELLKWISYQDEIITTILKKGDELLK